MVIPAIVLPYAICSRASRSVPSFTARGRYLGEMILASLLCAVQAGEVFAMRHLFDAVSEYISGSLFINGVVLAAVPMAVLLILL